MPWRPLRISAFLWWALWTLVVIPCHTRGYIPLAPNAPRCPSCCSASQTQPPANPQSKTPAPDPCNCAICHLTAILTAPPAPILLSLNLARDPYFTPPSLHPLLSSATPREIFCRGPPDLT